MEHARALAHPGAGGGYAPRKPQSTALYRVMQAHLATLAPKAARVSKYIPWQELLRRTFAVEVKCQRCAGPLRL